MLMREVKPFSREELEAFALLYFQGAFPHPIADMMDLSVIDADELTRLFKTALILSEPRE